MADELPRFDGVPTADVDQALAEADAGARTARRLLAAVLALQVVLLIVALALVARGS